jgi:hypothetical protein
MRQELDRLVKDALMCMQCMQMLLEPFSFGSYYDVLWSCTL